MVNYLRINAVASGFTEGTTSTVLHRLEIGRLPPYCGIHLPAAIPAYARREFSAEFPIIVIYIRYQKNCTVSRKKTNHFVNIDILSKI